MNEIEDHDPAITALAAVHDTLSSRHSAARSRLLKGLQSPPVAVGQPARLPLGWIGLGALATAAALAVWIGGIASPAAAMERMVEEIERVMSFSYRMEETIRNERRACLIESVYEGKWRRDPLAVWGTMRIWNTAISLTDPADVGPRRQVVDVWEAHRAGESGIVVDHLKRQAFPAPPIDRGNALTGGTPVAVILKVAKQRGRRLRGLGTRRIAGRESHGVEILLDGSNPADAIDGAPQGEEGRVGEGALWRNERVEVWLDPQSGLPVEFQSVRRGNGYERRVRYSNLRWNEAFPDHAFEPVTPVGYDILERSPFAESPQPPARRRPDSHSADARRE